MPRGVAEFLSDLGNTTIALPVLAVVIAYSGWQSHRRRTARWWLPGLSAAVSMAAVPALVVPFKEFVARPAPPTMEGVGYYPSGHTATASVAYGACVLLILPLLRSPVTRRVLRISWAVLSVAVGIGLVRCAYHWPLDVLASWCLAVILLELMALTAQRENTGPGPRGQRRPSPRRPREGRGDSRTAD
ncbi:phosphatase PAP2 family protein [Streptomyces tsukubensis]|nr:phosphatase PAP2 family protein [Streptomyces tsukubensis]